MNDSAKEIDALDSRANPQRFERLSHFQIDASFIATCLISILLLGGCADPTVSNALRRMNREAEQSGSPYRYRATPDGNGIEKYEFVNHAKTSERWVFGFDSREWYLGFEASTATRTIREYVLTGQTIENWTELVTSLFDAAAGTPKEVFGRFRTDLARDCPSLRISIIEESAESILLEWQHEGCQGFPAQHEIRRITSARGGILTLSFAQKTRQLMPDKRRTWLSIIRAASVRPEA
jgi:hypothetical protein